jgi:hypothetical protein
MNLRKITSRAIVAGATTALAAGTLVGFTNTAANAVENTTAYACAMTSPMPMDLGTFSLLVETPVIPPTVTAGQAFPGGLLGLTATLTIPSPYGQALANFGVDHADSPDYAVQLGSTSIGAPLAFEEPTVNPDGSATVLGAGANKAFTVPQAGTYKAMLPGTFTLNTELTMSPGADPTPATINCTTATPGDLGTVQVTKAASALAAKSKNRKVNVTVKRLDDFVPTGKVTAKLGKKIWTERLQNGKAVFAMPRSAKGKKVTVSYKGDKYTAAADAIKVLVK